MSQKKLLIIIASSVLVLGVAIYLASSPTNNNPETSVTEQPSVNVSTQEPNPQTNNTPLVQNYLPYSEKSFLELADKQRLVFFHADWCVYCRTFEEELLNSDGLPEDIVIFKANFDNDTELKKKFGVNTSSLIVLVDKNGEPVKIWHTTQFPTIDKLVAAVREN